MEELIDKILEIHRLGCEIDEQVPTCTMGEGHPPRWHISGFENFRKVADALNKGKYRTIDYGTGPYRYRYEFKYRGVEIFALDNKEQI